MERGPQGRAALVQAIRRRLEARQEIVFAVLHGSVLDEGLYRDVDVAVWMDHPDRSSRYAVELGAALTVEIGTPVDIQILNDAPLGFRFHALSGRLLFARDENFFHELRERTWDDYFDFLPFARENLQELLRG